MDRALTLWAVIVIVGALNYLSRLSFIAFFAQRQMPPLLARALRYVPAAMLTALVLPMVVVGAPSVATLASPRVIAASVAAVVGDFPHNTLATRSVGMAGLGGREAVRR